MARKVFVSYSHRQGRWVWNRLVPCLRAGGAKVLIDRERFSAGKLVLAQMDATQDAADMNVLVLSPEYLDSDYCVNEMKRAIRQDPRFKLGRVLPLVRRQCDVPSELLPAFRVDLRNDRRAEAWEQLFKVCDADLGIAAPDWMVARDDLLRHFRRRQSVNLLVNEEGVAWRPLIKELAAAFPDLARVDLQNPATASRRGLVEQILRASGVVKEIPREPEDLVELSRALEGRAVTRVAFLHFDLAADRSSYGSDLFVALRYLVMESKKLVLVVHSRRPFAALIPPNPLSRIDVGTIELRRRT